MNKTIAAISTPPGTGGISVIRISGDDAVKIADRVYSGKTRLCDAPSHTVHYGFIVDENGARIDEVLVTVMRAPKTYTAEDIVEIGAHGGIIVTSRVLDAVIRAGASAAAPGEFTKRAFLNGRIDLSRAEAVIDIINAGNVLAGKNAFKQLEGSLSNEIISLRTSLIDLLARMQVAIDYPDEDLEDITVSEISSELKAALSRVKALIKGADSGKILRDGIRAAIAGKPNVGKSSLLNCLVREERAIVTDIAGTTRDVIEEYASVGGVPLRLFDTAGIRSTDDTVERLGVERSRQSIDAADLVIVVLDATSPLTSDDIDILHATEGKKRVILINKTDVSSKDPVKDLCVPADDPVIRISAKTGAGIDEFSAAVSRMYGLGELEADTSAVITNARHKAALAEAELALSDACFAIDSGIPQDIVTIDINRACDSLGEITGETVTEDVVENIFHNFCVGK